MRTWPLVIFLAASGVASADNRSDADAYARKGVALYNLGKYEDAIAAFEQAYTLFQSDALLFNLAQAHRQLEHCELALQYYRRFMDGQPAPALAAQVEGLLPKLEAACRTKDERPKGPVTTHSADEPEVVAAKEEPVEAESVEAEAPVAPAPPTFAVTGGLVAGGLIAGQAAPLAGFAVGITTPVEWLHGAELGALLSAGHLWRGDVDGDATIAAIDATVQFHSDFPWGRLTIGGGLGAAYFSSLGFSSGVVPGVTRAGQWAPQARVDVGAEHDVAPSLSLRFGVGLAACPLVGDMLSPVGQFEALVGMRYER